MKAMILAAGLGMRLRPLTNNMPKCLVLVNDKPLLYYHLRALEKARVTDVVINLGWRGDQIESYVRHKTNFSFKIHFSVEPSDHPLETGGGIYKALDILGDETFAVINSDIWTDYPFEHLCVYQLPKDALGYLVLVPPSIDMPGDYFLQGDIVRTANTSTNSLTFSGISLLSRGLFTQHHKTPLPERFPLRMLFEPNIIAGRLRGTLYTEGEWRDIGTIENVNQLRAHIESASNTP